MALTKLNALGSAIRAKVGETEKKTLSELTEIVEDELMTVSTYEELLDGILDVLADIEEAEENE